jgi:hypothetical protein
MSENNEDNLSRKLNIHSPINPPAPGSSTDAKIILINQNHFTLTDWIKSNSTGVTLTISDPISLGLVDFQEYTVEKFIDNIILACNLILKHGAFSKHTSDSSHTIIQRKKTPSIPATVEDTPTGKKIVIQEVLTLTDSVHITMGFEDELDENEVVSILRKIINIETGTVTSNLNIQDLQKALREYYSGTTSFERLGIFKHLFSSIELSTNCDGNDRKNSTLDNEINKISNVELMKITDFRKFNARTKHIDKHLLHRSEYKEGMGKIGEKIIYAREAAQKIILNRLSSI